MRITIKTELNISLRLANPPSSFFLAMAVNKYINRMMK
jgi:hypothetical protein